MPRRKKRTEKDPVDTSYLKYEILGRTVISHDTYDEHIVIIKKICIGNPAETFETVQNVCYNISKEEVVHSIKPITRARNSKGQYIKDDPNTPENEAWVGGKAPSLPKKKRGRPRKKKNPIENALSSFIKK